MNRPEISVVLPLYGSFDVQRSLIVIESIKLQKNVLTEIVVSEQGEQRRFPNVEGVKYTFKYHRPQEHLSDFNPGNVRNLAIAKSTANLIYTNDSDIVFTDPNYLERSADFLQAEPNRVLYRPFMRRLPLNNFSTFCSWVSESGLEIAISKLHKNQEFLLKTSPDYREMKVFSKKSEEANYTKTFASLIEDYQEYVRRGLGSDEKLNFWPVYWNENRHCGANMFRRTHFENVGGYCEDFINWGCEDSDLQWKFRETLKLDFFPEDLEVLHLDHPKGYVSPKMWAENEKACSQRRNIEGLKASIQRDGNKYRELANL